VLQRAVALSLHKKAETRGATTYESRARTFCHRVRSHVDRTANASWRPRSATSMYLKTCFQMNVLPEPVVGKLLGAKDDEPKFELAHMSFAGQEKRAKFPTSKAPISAVFHSFWLTFGRAIISRNGLEAWMLFPERARAEHSR